MPTYKLSKSSGNGHVYSTQTENGWVRSKIDLTLMFGKEVAEGLFQSVITVRHGHIKDGKCSVCGHHIKAWANDFVLCPYCGAQMDEV